ncbi:hypothetical protein QTP86_019131, partial [Hemibagrus guttatus]
ILSCIAINTLHLTVNRHFVDCFSVIPFLIQCRIQFRLQPSSLSTEESKVKDEMATRDLPPDLNRLIEVAVRIDHRIQERDRERESQQNHEYSQTPF